MNRAGEMSMPTTSAGTVDASSSPYIPRFARGSFPNALRIRLGGRKGSDAIVFEEFQTSGDSRKTVKRGKRKRFEDSGY